MLLVLTAFAVNTPLNVQFTMNSGKASAVTAFRDDSSVVWISVPEICSRAEIKTVWAAERRKLLLYFAGKDIQLIESNPYLYSDGKLADMGASPVMVKGEMYLQAKSAALLLSLISGKVMEFDPVKNTIVSSTDKNKVVVTSAVRDTSKVIRKVSVEEKKNGTMLSIFLPDSLVYDFTYFKPQLNINVVNGRISTSEIRRDSPLGLVNEIDAVQFAENGQISVILSDKAMAPEVRFKSSPYRIEVVIRGNAIYSDEKAAADSAKIDSVRPQTSVQPENKAPSRIKTIILDPGHGGKDPGAVNKKLKAYEKDAVLSLGLLAAKKIEELNPGVKVKLTRDTDVFIPLGERAKVANKADGDLFISIHLNSIKGNATKQASVTGHCVYFLDVARNDEARAVAALENAALEFEEKPEVSEDVSNVDFILKSSELNLYRNESEDFAIMIEKAMTENIKDYTAYRGGVDQAGFYVLRGPEMPSVLIEAGFVCNPTEARLLFNPSTQEKIASAIAVSVGKFREKYENKTSPR
ncbi:MAG: N-acetylmuramoyl-L-alanine amidase [Fibrobacteres bacterium]|nr:N-acetylmuramoyl-L-alanine amidase [Fibrobacterota bacterium]